MYLAKDVHYFPCLWNARFLLENDLSVAGNPGTEGSGKGKSFVKRVGVERLGATKYSSHGFYTCSDDIIVGVLWKQTNKVSMERSPP